MIDLMSVSIEVLPEDEPSFTLRSNDMGMSGPICERADLTNALIAFGRFLAILAGEARGATEDGERGD